MATQQSIYIFHAFKPVKFKYFGTGKLLKDTIQLFTTVATTPAKDTSQIVSCAQRNHTNLFTKSLVNCSHLLEPWVSMVHCCLCRRVCRKELSLGGQALTIGSVLTWSLSIAVRTHPTVPSPPHTINLNLSGSSCHLFKLLGKVWNQSKTRPKGRKHRRGWYDLWG